MNTSTAWIALAAVLTLGGCTQTLPIKGNGAHMDVRLSNDATGTTMQIWQVLKYEDETCQKAEKGVMLSTTMFGKGKTSLDPLALPTDGKLTLAFFYLDARFGMNTQCGYTLTFLPVENEHYTARFAVSGNVSTCNVALTNQTGQPVKAIAPEYSCHDGVVAERILNGGRGVKHAQGVTVYSR